MTAVARPALSLLAALACAGLAPPATAQGGREIVTVAGVDDGEMLKLRAGPGTGFRVIVGLPEGTELIDRGCDRIGGTPWCEVALRAAPRLRGYVSGHYLHRE